MRKNPWDKMPQSYFDHVNACRYADGGFSLHPPCSGDAACKSHTKKARVVRRAGWVHKAHAFDLGGKYPSGIRGGWIYDLWVSVVGQPRKRDSSAMWKYRKKHPMCEVCKASPSDHTHHIVPVGRGGGNGKGNLIAVCVGCHRGMHPEINKGFIAKREFPRTPNRLQK